MLDLRGIRQDPEGVRGAIASKHEAGAIEALDALLAADSDWRRLLRELETLRAERNALSAEVGRAVSATGQPPVERSALRELSRRIKGMEEQVRELETAVRAALMQLPNIPHPAVPLGASDAENVVVRHWGEPPTFDFEPQAHWDLGRSLGLLDFERAGKISGARFTVFRGHGALLERGLSSLMLKLHTQRHGCTEILPPFLVNSLSMTGTGNLPKFGADAFSIDGHDLWLVPTAEVPVTNLYRDEILAPEALPIRHVAYTPCWRSEAGAAGRDTRGLIRQHQFDKVELVHFVAPEDSPAHLAEIIAAAEAVLQLLGLPYRLVRMCTGDLGFSASEKFDLEVWMPSYERYVEISSCSNFTDFQARRANIRFRRTAEASPEFVHTLNGSALAVGRCLAAVLENGQQPDGSVRLPRALGQEVGLEVLS